jgi:REP element-mobilizing transposase RayT
MSFMLYPMAYHITWGTYGSRLHGSPKPHVDRDHNQYKGPFAPIDPIREDEARARMKRGTVTLSPEQRKPVEQAIRDIAAKYGWTIHQIAVQGNHVHAVITANREGEQLRDALKAVASKALNKKYGTRTWWAEKGSAKYLWERDYFANAKKYVRDQRDAPP